MTFRDPPNKDLYPLCRLKNKDLWPCFATKKCWGPSPGGGSVGNADVGRV